MKRKFSSGDSSGAENQKMAKLDDSSDEDDEEVETKSTRLGVSITWTSVLYRNVFYSPYQSQELAIKLRILLISPQISDENHD